MAPRGGGIRTQCEPDVQPAQAVVYSKQQDLPQILHENVRLVSKAVSHRESRLAFGRVLRTTAAVRSQLNADELKNFFCKVLRRSSSLLQPLIGVLAEDSVREVFNDQLCKQHRWYCLETRRQQCLLVEQPGQHASIGDKLS